MEEDQQFDMEEIIKGYDLWDEHDEYIQYNNGVYQCTNDAPELIKKLVIYLNEKQESTKKVKKILKDAFNKDKLDN